MKKNRPGRKGNNISRKSISFWSYEHLETVFWSLTCDACFALGEPKVKLVQKWSYEHLCDTKIRGERRMGYEADPLGESIFVELQSIEDRGILIFMEGFPSSPQAVTAMLINSNLSYMRDYIFEQGRLKELRFDRVCSM